jgi:hypothetical protein
MNPSVTHFQIVPVNLTDEELGEIVGFKVKQDDTIDAKCTLRVVAIDHHKGTITLRLEDYNDDT